MTRDRLSGLGRWMAAAALGLALGAGSVLAAPLPWDQWEKASRTGPLPERTVRLILQEMRGLSALSMARASAILAQHLEWGTEGPSAIDRITRTIRAASLTYEFKQVQTWDIPEHAVQAVFRFGLEAGPRPIAEDREMLAALVERGRRWAASDLPGGELARERMRASLRPFAVSLLRATYARPKDSRSSERSRLALLAGELHHGTDDPYLISLLTDLLAPKLRGRRERIHLAAALGRVVKPGSAVDPAIYLEALKPLRTEARAAFARACPLDAAWQRRILYQAALRPDKFEVTSAALGMSATASEAFRLAARVDERDPGNLALLSALAGKGVGERQRLDADWPGGSERLALTRAAYVRSCLREGLRSAIGH